MVFLRYETPVEFHSFALYAEQVWRNSEHTNTEITAEIASPRYQASERYQCFGALPMVRSATNAT
eukprot:UN20854